MASTPAFLFIPDISGFTEFVSQTDTSHSQHIISELLELIIDTNELDLVVSEIEGDAVLFYREGPPPSPDEVKQQSEKIFLAFHNYLNSYKSRRMCQCGACTTASKLTLKIVAHYGEIGYVKVRDFNKPHGSEVILAHRLMKNEVNDHEYVLYTNALVDYWASKNLTLACETFPCTSEYDQFGEVHYQYATLGHLHDEIQDLPPVPHHPVTPNPVRGEIFINSPIEEVYEIVSNLDFRLQWNKGIDGLKYDLDRVNRVGTLHTCLIQGKTVDLTTITRDFGPDKRVYGEHVDDPPIVEEMSVYHIMEPKDDGTLVRQEMHITPKKGLKGLFTPIFRILSKKNLTTLNTDLKQYIESKG